MLETLLPIILDESLGGSLDAPPAYSFEPSCGEQRLDLTPRGSRGRNPLTGSVIKRFGKLTMILPEQEEGAQIPAYGRHDVISGTFCFDDPSNLTSVTIQVHGKVESTTTEYGSKTTRLIDDSYTLWKKDDAGQSSSSGCPSQLPFSCPLPATYVEDDKETPLPPSFHTFDHGFYVKTYYCIYIEITRKRRSKFDFGSRIKRYSVPFKYCPRTRPNRPIEQTPCFLSSVKELPEEWHQSTSNLKTHVGVTREPLHCHFFVPSVRIFGLRDSIPFHIQLNGPISSLREFFPPDALRRITSADSSISVPSFRPNTSSSKSSETKQHSVRVKLVRQVVINNQSCKIWRNSVLGEGVVHPLPPPLYRDQCLGSRDECLDWTGYIKANEDVTSGSFATGCIQVQHFLSLTLTSPDVRKSPFQVLTVHVPIKMVTDSYSEFG